ncbi:MAG: sulfatase [Actinobacteria bacterium]|nr:sulfatase [Actinomycetota bacterium]
MQDRIDRKTFLRVAGAGAAAATVWRPGAAALAARTRAAQHAPNVLVIVLDSTRHDYVGAYGNTWMRTPTIDALARESLRFTRAFPEAMPTVPARRSLMMGRRVYPWHDWKPTRNLPGSPGWTGLSAQTTTWLKTLRRHGYWTGYVTDNPFLGFAPEWAGFRSTLSKFHRVGGQVGALHPAGTISERDVLHWLPQGMRTERYLKGMRQHLANVDGGNVESESCAARVFSRGIDELVTAMRNRPFALVVDSFDPHEPWTPPQKYLDLYGDRHYDGSWPGNVQYKRSGYMPAAAVKRLPTVYGASLTLADTWMGRFLERFYASGLQHETVVVFLSDHGILLGDRGWTGKPALELHPELIQVPFLLRDPSGRMAGQTTPYFVSPHDVGPTLLRMTGMPTPSDMNGVDLSPLLSGGRPRLSRRFCFGGYANHWYYRDDRWALIADGNNSGRELFDLTQDPGEQTSVARDHPALLDTIYQRVLHSAGARRLPFFSAAD